MQKMCASTGRQNTTNSCVHYLFLDSRGPHGLVILASKHKILVSGTPGRTLTEALVITYK
jgi:hypothetical protein